MPNKSIAIVGSGATAIYLLKQLLAAGKPLSIVIFESSAVAGTGMPYSPFYNSDHMLCNAYSREIPVVTQSLVAWLRALPVRELNAWELLPGDVNARAFYPRTLIGEFFQNELSRLVNSAPEFNCTVEVCCNAMVDDIGPIDHGKAFVTTALQPDKKIFDAVIIATGHCWPTHPQIDGVPLISPWPYTSIAALKESNVAIIGSSLSAIDVVITLGVSHGEFIEKQGKVSWKSSKRAKNFKVTMLSLMGIMPEGDFYYPYPYEPLTIISPEAVRKEVSMGSEHLLDRVFNLLIAELNAADSAYIKKMGKDAYSIEGFSKAYFRHRQDIGGLKAVKLDFAKVQQSMRDKQTIAHRYALLRAHEHFDLALRSLNTADWEIFTEKLLPVFADCYAAIPHLSVARIIALYDAGVLSLIDTQSEAKFSKGQGDRVDVQIDETVHSFDAIIDARGQAAAPVKNIGFPTLQAALLDGEKPIQAPFMVKTTINPPLLIYCLALPQLLEKYPFSQGLQNCADNAAIVANDILAKL